MNSHELEQVLPRSGYPIRKSTGQSVFAALRSNENHFVKITNALSKIETVEVNRRYGALLPTTK
jgi:hypothetical protein